jgi:NAD(P)-dependent dehydrogenase (short-subunit alcohol dehydrogenase family)
MSQIVFVTGANRGLGLAVTRVLLAQGDTVFAACRDPHKPDALADLKAKYPTTLKIVQLDVNNDVSSITCGETVASQTDRLDVLLNVAGIQTPPYDQQLENLDYQNMRNQFETNVIGPLRVTRALLPLLRKGKNPRVANWSSGVGSIAMTDNPNFYAYGASKAALNKVTKTLSIALKKDGITVVVLDPGWVRTDLGGPNAPLSPEESAIPTVATINKLDMTFTGKYIYNDGKELPW